MSDMSDMTELMTMEEAAATLGRSVRTIQRHLASGVLRGETRDGRTMVHVERPAAASVAAIQRQADDTGRVAALAAVTGERAALAYQERAAELERRVGEERRALAGWRVAALAAGAVAVATGVALSWAWGDRAATRDTLADTRARLEAAEVARGRLELAMVEVTRRDIVAQLDAQLAASCPD